METDLKELQRVLHRIEATMVTKKQLMELLETLAVLSKEYTLRQILTSEKQIRAGKVKLITRVSQL